MKSALLALSLLLPLQQGEQAATSQAALRRQLAVEEGLLAQALRAHGEARTRQKAAWADLQVAADRAERALANAAASEAEAERAVQDLDVAEAAVGVLSGRVAELQRTALEERRRIAALRAELARSPSLAAASSDPITGQWRIEISSPAEVGTFDLELEGTQVRGRYTFQGGKSGSLSGTFIDGRLRLERIDHTRGLDGVFEGSVDGSLETVRGFWSPSILSDGGPGGAGWSGVRTRRGRAPAGAAGE